VVVILASLAGVIWVVLDANDNTDPNVIVTLFTATLVDRPFRQITYFVGATSMSLGQSDAVGVRRLAAALKLKHRHRRAGTAVPCATVEVVHKPGR
jgi:hypothetical protein